MRSRFFLSFVERTRRQWLQMVRGIRVSNLNAARITRRCIVQLPILRVRVIVSCQMRSGLTIKDAAMVNQKAISVKLDVDTLLQLDRECDLGYMKRNRIINEAVRMYLDAKDTKRRWRLAQSIEEKAAEYAQFNLRWFSHL